MCSNIWYICQPGCNDVEFLYTNQRVACSCVSVANCHNNALVLIVATCKTHDSRSVLYLWQCPVSECHYIHSSYQPCIPVPVAMSCLERSVCCMQQQSTIKSVGISYFCILLSAEALAAVAGAIASKPEWIACLKAVRPLSLTQEALDAVASTNLLPSDHLAKLRYILESGKVTAQAH